MLGWFRLDDDPASAYPEVAVHRKAVRDGDWASARAVYDRASWELRQLCVNDSARLPEAGQFLRRVVGRDPDDAVAATMLGSWLVDAGWKVRTGMRAQHVSRERFAVFHEHLRQAEAVLASVCARDPVNPPAWTARLSIARGLQMGQAESRRRYDSLSRHVPNYLEAQRKHLQQVCPKWGGSFGALHDFAQECTEAAPPGAHNAMLVAEAHLEHRLELNEWRQIRSYFKRDDVRQDIRAAAERSVFHPSFQHSPGWVAAMTRFALAFALIKDWQAAKQCFVQLGRYGDTEWWAWWVVPFASNNKQAFRSTRAKAMRRG